jgi:hypothetical protein
MSSTLERPTFDIAATPPVPHVVLDAAGSTDAAPNPTASGVDEIEFAGFGRAIVVGVAVGIPLMMALVAASVKLVAPNTEWVDVLVISTWVALFCGPFMAGTVTVGLWSSRHHR